MPHSIDERRNKYAEAPGVQKASGWGHPNGYKDFNPALEEDFDEDVYLERAALKRTP